MGNAILRGTVRKARSPPSAGESDKKRWPTGLIQGGFLERLHLCLTACARALPQSWHDAVLESMTAMQRDVQGG